MWFLCRWAQYLGNKLKIQLGARLWKEARAMLESIFMTK